MKSLISIILLFSFFSSIALITNKKNIEFVYPDGNTKALIMSYDDAIMDDIKLIRLFNDNNIIGTFNINSGYLSTTRAWYMPNGDTLYQTYISKDSLNFIYQKHEIAAHGTFHKSFTDITDNEILEEVNSDISNLSALTKRKIKSMAYPFGNSNEHIASLINQTDITNARTINDTYTFDLPKNYLLWDPTCHDTKALDLLDKYLALNVDTLTVFYVWGHSWEHRDSTRWNNMVEFCKKAGNRNDIWYVGCGEFIDYQIALRSLIVSHDFIENPKNNKQIWLKVNGTVKALNPGEKISVKFN